MTAERTTTMKTTGTGLAALTFILSGTLFFGGCYTQFYRTESEPPEEAEAQPVIADQPVVIAMDYLPPPVLYGYPLFSPSVPVVTGHGSGSGGTAVQPTRTTGAQRSNPSPAPAPAPARSAGSRSSGGSGGRR